MKIKLSDLKQIIKEEYDKLNEISSTQLAMLELKAVDYDKRFNTIPHIYYEFIYNDILWKLKENDIKKIAKGSNTLGNIAKILVKTKNFKFPDSREYEKFMKKNGLKYQHS